MADFYSILTTVGKAALANAAALGKTVTLTEMAVGDGNGEAVSPTEDMTELVNEVYRAEINTPVVVDDITMRAELVISTEDGGFYVREVGLFDENGELFAVANLPETYKPSMTEGAGRELTVALLMEISNSDNITLTIDPTVVLASRTDVANAIGYHNSNESSHADIRESMGALNVHPPRKDNPHDVTTGQIGAARLDTAQNWTAQQVFGAVALTCQASVDWDLDTQQSANLVLTGDATLAAPKNQRDGGRYRLLVVQDGTGGHSLTFNAAYAAELLPPLDQAAGAATLYVFDSDGTVMRSCAPLGIPVGTVAHYASETPPPGWLVRDGADISRAIYSKLFGVIGTTFGAGDGETTFNLPDDRNLFDRGMPGGGTIGTYQDDEFKSHTHTFPAGGNSGDGPTKTSSGGTMSTSATGGDETRPKNRHYLPIIKY